MPTRLTTTAVLAAAGLLVAATATAAATPDRSCPRGRPLASTPLVDLSRQQVAAELAAAGLPGDAGTGVTEFRIEYCTVSATGAPTTASGLLALPQGRRGRLPLVAYAHSTVAARTGVPSFRTQTEGRVVPLFFGSAGFAVAAPDYLGLGTSPGTHPYVHAATEASATLDLLAAVDQVAARRGVRLSRAVLVSGHSQGGHATMAIGRALQASPGPWRAAGLAPMAGPYDLSGTEIPATLDPTRTDQQHAAVYLAYLFTSWRRLYRLYTDPAEVFTARYAPLVEGLFDGTHEFDEIDAALPAAAQLLRPGALTLVAHPTGRFAAALRANDVCRWAPAAPVRLYTAQLDTDVVPANAERCQQQLTAHGGSARIVDAGPVDHVGTAIASLPLIRTWFLHLSSRPAPAPPRLRDHAPSALAGTHRGRIPHGRGARAARLRAGWWRRPWFRQPHRPKPAGEAPGRVHLRPEDHHPFTRSPRNTPESPPGTDF